DLALDIVAGRQGRAQGVEHVEHVVPTYRRAPHLANHRPALSISDDGLDYRSNLEVPLRAAGGVLRRPGPRYAASYQDLPASARPVRALPGAFAGPRRGEPEGRPRSPGHTRAGEPRLDGARPHHVPL